MTSVLELDLSSGSAPGTYQAKVLSSPGGEAAGTFQLNPAEVIEQLDQLQEALLASSVPSRRLLSREESSVRSVGRSLFDAVFAHTDVGGVYRASRAVAEERGEPLRLALRIGAPELAAMPWESMFDAAAGSYVSRREPLVRYVAVPSSPPPMRVRLPLRILAVIASPRGLAQLDVERERDNLTHALGSLIDSGAVAVEWLEHATWPALQDALLSGTWHVVHLIGHGDFDIERDEGVLALETEAGRVHRVSAESFLDLLRQASPVPRLVVLNACESSTGGSVDLFAGTAATLVRGGISAVSAMQFEISDQAAIAFCRGFYTAIGRGRGVDEAVRSGRVAILGAVEGSLEWITPTLYLRGQETHLFEVAGPAQNPPPPPPPPQRPWWRRPVVAAGAALLVIAAAVLAFTLWPDGGRTPRTPGTTDPTDAVQSVDVTVDGTRDWTDTGIDVLAGDRVAVTADGQVWHNQGNAIGPEGFPNRPDLITPYPELNHAALIGRVGTDGAVFYAGRAVTVTAQADGRLFLGVNDGGLENNSGHWNATVTVEPGGD